MKHVFIVGLPRTGTKLVRNVLRNAQRIDCGISPETWFFGDLFRPGLRRVLRKCGDMSDDRNVRKFVDYMYSGRFRRTLCNLLHQGDMELDRTVLESEFLKTDRSDRAIYDALMKAVGRSDSARAQTGHSIIGDKTPGHLYYVPTIMAWFPDAKVVHTFRDPRAIAASEWKRVVKPGRHGWWSNIWDSIRTVSVVVYVTVTWLYAVRLHHIYSRRYPGSYYLSKYEDLVTDPDTSVSGLCEFIGIDAEEAMLNPSRSGSSFARREGAGFDKAAVERWRVHLKPWMRAWLAFWTGRYLKEFGYRP